MTAWIVVPAKAAGLGKSRLAGALDPAGRAALVQAMLAHVVAVAGAAPAVVHLLGADRHGLNDAIPLIPDPGAGLNDALTAARALAVDRGAPRLLFLAGDLPRLTRADVDALLALDNRTIGIAPDRADDGTNALSLPLPAAAAFRPHYGPGSRRAHEEEALRLGLSARLVRTPTLALDIDTPADLALVDDAMLQAGTATGIGSA